jgi:hypothetical protein
VRFVEEEVLIMNRAKGRVSLRVTLATAFLFLTATIGRAQTPLGTTFTYQGQLQNNAVPENGSCDLQFKLFDAALGGGQIGSTITDTGITVTNGLFTVTLDFGAGAFVGNARWLEIAVACPSGSGFTTLSPRQELTPSPNALFAASAAVSTDATLTGNGTSGTPLGIAAGGVNTAQLANSGVTTGKLSATGSSSGQVLTSNGSAVAWQAPTGLSSVSHDTTLTGNGTGGTPLGVATPLALVASTSSGVVGAINSGTGQGVSGFNANGVGVLGASTNATGVVGQSTGATGVSGTSSTGSGVYGTTEGASGQVGAAGVWGDSNSYFGVWGTSGSADGVHGNSNSGNGVFGFSASGWGIRGQTGSTAAGIASMLGDNGDSGVTAFYTTSGVIGQSSGGYGVYGASAGPWPGVVAASVNGYGIYAFSTNAYAAYLDGNVHVSGTLTSGVKDFRIDHPLDPANKYLVHSSVESSEMKNMYDGIVTLDGAGEAVVHLPDWFQVENRDFRYQLTCVGDLTAVYIKKEIENNQFTIAGVKPGVKVSWQVTGVRQDAYARAHPLVVEVAKSDSERGHYLHPELYGQPGEGSLRQARAWKAPNRQ